MSNVETMFIKATREKMRFPYKGLISVEDLWDLPVTELDKIYKELNKKVKLSQEESLLDTKSDKDEELNTKIEIIKYIVNVKLEERKNAEKAQQRKQEKEKIMSILASKQNEVLQSKSIEELTKMLEVLEELE